MIDDLADILNRLVNQKDNLHVRFPDPDISEPALAFKVPFPRLEIVLEGELKESGLPLSETMLSASQVLYVQAGKWTLPEWTGPASTLSILFGRQKLGFCVQYWDGKQLRTEKQNVARLGPRVGSYLLLSLNEICLQPDPVTARLVVAALLSHCLEQLVGLEMRVSRSRDLFLAVQDYLEEHLSQPLTRESVAKRFHITPNYLSHIFQKSGSVGFNEFLTSVRLEKAKKLLRGYDLKVKRSPTTAGSSTATIFAGCLNATPSVRHQNIVATAAARSRADSDGPLDPPATVIFGLIEGVIDLFNEQVLRFPFVTQTNADTDRQRMVVVDQDRPGVLQNSLRQFIHFLRRHSVDNNGKLFAANPRRQHLIAGELSQLLTESKEDFVPHQMAPGVINFLEVIDIDNH